MDIDSVTLDLGAAGEYGMSAALALMMFAVALNLTPQSFSFFRDKPRLYFGGLFAQLFGLPALTLLLILAIDPRPSIALGMIIVACCPGGSTSNLLTLFARGNSALSVALTATTSVLACIFTPVFILFWSGLYAPTRELLTSLNINTLSFLLQTFLILAVPIMIGMGIRHYRPTLADKWKGGAGAIGGLLLLAIIIGAILGSRDILLQFGHYIFPIVIAHNILALGLGWMTGTVLKSGTANRRALTIEIGIQNSGLALVLLISQLSGLGGATAIAGVWGIWHLIAGGGFMLLCRWHDGSSRPVLENV